MIEVKVIQPSMGVSYQTKNIYLSDYGLSIAADKFSYENGRVRIVLGATLREELLTLLRAVTPNAPQQIEVNGDPIYPEDLKCEDEEA